MVEVRLKTPEIINCGTVVKLLKSSNKSNVRGSIEFIGLDIVKQETRNPLLPTVLTYFEAKGALEDLNLAKE